MGLIKLHLWLVDLSKPTTALMTLEKLTGKASA